MFLVVCPQYRFTSTTEYAPCIADSILVCIRPEGFRTDTLYHMATILTLTYYLVPCISNRQREPLSRITSVLLSQTMVHYKGQFRGKITSNNITVIFKYIHNRNGLTLAGQFLIFCSKWRLLFKRDKGHYKISVIISVRMNILSA